MNIGLFKFDQEKDMAYNELSLVILPVKSRKSKARSISQEVNMRACFDFVAWPVLWLLLLMLTIRYVPEGSWRGTVVKNISTVSISGDEEGIVRSAFQTAVKHQGFRLSDHTGLEWGNLSVRYFNRDNQTITSPHELPSRVIFAGRLDTSPFKVDVTGATGQTAQEMRMSLAVKASNHAVTHIWVRHSSGYIPQ
jgi:hypothetical protein